MRSRPARSRIPHRAALFAAGLALIAGPATSQSRVGPNALGNGDRPMPGAVQEIAKNGIQQRLGASLPLDTPLRDQNGNPVKLGDYFGQDKPVIIEFAYFDCPLLCPMVEAGIIRGTQAAGWVPGDEFTVLTVSISPLDTPAEALERQADIVERFGGSDTELGAGARAGWHLLTGRPIDVKALADAAGFGYTALPQGLNNTQDFAHAAVIVFASPSGTITRYLPGFKYSERAFRTALMEASEGRLGSIFDMVLQLCFHFDDSTGKYTANALTLMKFAGAVTVATLATVVGGMFFFERKRRLRLGTDDTSAA